MTTPSTPEEQRATPDQLAELRTLAADAGEELPEGMTAVEAEQRLVELRGRG